MSPAELSWRPEEEERTAAPFCPGQPTPPETPDGWKKGSGCRSPKVLALLFNEPFSWDFTHRRAGAICSQQQSPDRADNGTVPSAAPRHLGSAQPLGMQEALCGGHGDRGHETLSCPLLGLSKPTLSSARGTPSRAPIRAGTKCV